MADMETNVLQQASVDYLSQINRNVVALNSTAIAQKDLAERQLTTQEITSSVLKETHSNTLANVQNQAYMAYGTFQHDMKGLMGVTDEGTRVAMTSMNIAGSRFVGDVSGAGTVVGNAAVGATASTMNRVANFMRPGTYVDQGLTGAAASLLGITRGSTAYTASEWEEISQRQVGGLGQRFAAHFTLNPFSRKSEYDATGRQFDLFAYRLGKQGAPILSQEDVMDIGRNVTNSQVELERKGYKTEDAKSIMNIAQLSEFQSSVSTTSKDKLIENMKRFADYASELATQFHTTGQDMANALKDLRAKTGLSLEKTKDLLQINAVRAQQMGYSPEEALSVTSNALDISTALGYRAGGTKEAMNVLNEVRKRAGSNAEYLESIGGEGGIENRRNLIMGSRDAFMKSSMGLLYGSAMGQGFSMTGSVADLAMSASKGLAGGYGDLFKLRYKQIMGEDLGKMGKAMTHKALSQFRILYPDAKLEDIKKGGRYADEFGGFLSFTEQIMTRDALESRLAEIRDEGIRIDETESNRLLDLKKADIAKEGTSAAGGLAGLRASAATNITQSDIQRSASFAHQAPVSPESSITPRSVKDSGGTEKVSAEKEAVLLFKLDSVATKLEHITEAERAKQQ